MRSTWSAETLLTALAAASVEAGALTLAYLALAWLSGGRAILLGVPSFAAAVVLGLVLARRLRRASWRRYLLVVPPAVILTAGVGGWVVETVHGTPADLPSVIGSPGSWLLGIAVLRGTAHAELDDEAYLVDRLLRVGIPGLALFWIVAAASRLTADPPYTAAAFGATLTFISSGLLGLGLGRLRELPVETVDRAANRRWLVLLLGVMGVVLVIGIPLAAVLQVPLSSVLAGAGGPLAVVVIAVFVVLAAPLLTILSALANTIGPVAFHINLPTISIGQGGGNGAPQDVVTVVLVVFGAIVAVELLGLLVIVVVVVRRARRRREPAGVERRESEPMALQLGLHRPTLRRRRWTATPTTAVEAYRLALRLLAGSDEGRRPGETPREHATRLRGSEVGASVGRLAADYQLAALGGRRLSEAEERRARGRWEDVRRRTR